MSSTLSRRNILRGVATGTVVAGWSAVTGSWVTAEAASDSGYSGMSRVPALDGTLTTVNEALGNFSKDFGNLVSWTPRVVLRPGSVDDISKMIRFARSTGLKIAMNGQSGTGQDLESHSSYGQAAVPGGITIDAKGLSQIRSIDATSAVVDSGVTWAELVNATLEQGKTPPALTDYIHLSIGGTASVGGIGGTVQKYGLQCDTVEAIQVVTGTGEITIASPTMRPDLFNAVLAGGGQCGIITRAKIKLIPAPARALVCSLFYNDLPTYLADQEKILQDGRFSHQEGEITRKPDDSGWRYRIEAVYYYTPPAAPDQAALLGDLRDDRASADISEMSYRDWVFRIDPFEVFLKEGGYWNQPKPWLSVVLPASKTRDFINSITPELTPSDLGAGFTGLYPFKTSKLTRPLFALPEPAEPVAYLFDILRFPFPDDPNIQGMLEQNRRFYDRSVRIGAKRYLVGAIPRMTKDDWRRHFGSNWNRFVAAKRQFDPDNVLTPGQGIFS